MEGMKLKILLPHKMFLDLSGVQRISVETSEGSFGILPRRLDCVATIEPGIMKYETSRGSVEYLAVDEGVLVKIGDEVTISVRNVMGGADLGKLHELVKSEFTELNEKEKAERDVMLKLESGFILSFEKFRSKKKWS